MFLLSFLKNYSPEDIKKKEKKEDQKGHIPYLVTSYIFISCLFKYFKYSHIFVLLTKYMSSLQEE